METLLSCGYGHVRILASSPLVLNVLRPEKEEGFGQAGKSQLAFEITEVQGDFSDVTTVPPLAAYCSVTWFLTVKSSLPDGGMVV